MVILRGSIATPDDIGHLSAYIFNLTDEPGSATSKNFLSLFNPSDSGMLVLIHSIEVECFATSTTSSVNSMCVYRTTAASGGTLAAASGVNRFSTDMPDPAGQVRYGSPTVTIDPVFSRVVASWAPPVGGSGQGSSPTVHADTPSKHFTCLPGQGIAFNVSAGDTNNRWKINVVWEEQDV